MRSLEEAWLAFSGSGKRGVAGRGGAWLAGNEEG